MCVCVCVCVLFLNHAWSFPVLVFMPVGRGVLLFLLKSRLRAPVIPFSKSRPGVMKTKETLGRPGVTSKSTLNPQA